ncbi:MAG: hypothetical protein ABIP77_05085 [Candidatus Limnocylindrales bacterium]
MGFVRGVITGVAISAGAAAWYLSRSGERVRDQYRLERRLGEVGDQLATRTREIQNSFDAQFAEMRARSDALDPAKASAAEAAAEIEASATAADQAPTR